VRLFGASWQLNYLSRKILYDIASGGYFVNRCSPHKHGAEVLFMKDTHVMRSPIGYLEKDPLHGKLTLGDSFHATGARTVGHIEVNLLKLPQDSAGLIKGVSLSVKCPTVARNNSWAVIAGAMRRSRSLAVPADAHG
jgi:hypothetical protein